MPAASAPMSADALSGDSVPVELLEAIPVLPAIPDTLPDELLAEFDLADGLDELAAR